MFSIAIVSFRVVVTVRVVYSFYLAISSLIPLVHYTHYYPLLLAVRFWVVLAERFRRLHVAHSLWRRSNENQLPRIVCLVDLYPVNLWPHADEVTIDTTSLSES